MAHTLFSATLGLSSPWRITAVSFSDAENRLDMTVDFQQGCDVTCPLCGSEADLLDSSLETWHHDDFFRFSAFLHALVPRIHCHKGCGIRKIKVPWARAGSRFTLLPETETD